MCASVCLYSVCLQSVVVYGQSLSVPPKPASWDIEPENAVFEHLTAKEGLPQNSVNAIIQDKRGFMWFATQDGLCRYDGSQMKVFRPKAGTPSALQVGYIYRLFVDSRSVLWVATSGGGLAQYNYTSGDFISYRHDPKNPKSLPGDNINDIAEDAEGNLWLAIAETGIARFNPKTGEAERFALPLPATQSGNKTNIGETRSLVVDKSGTVWVGIFGGGVYYFEPKTLRWVNIAVGTQDPEALPSKEIWYMTLDSYGMVWVATRNAGITVINTENRRVVAVHRNRAGDDFSLSNDNVWGAYEDSDKNLWVATSGGLCRFDRTTQSFRTYRSRPGCSTSLQSDVILAVCRDRERNLWVGMQLAGVAKLDRAAQRFSSFQEIGACANGILSQGIVRSIFEDTEKRLWVGTNRKGVNILEPLSSGGMKTTVLRRDSLNRHTIAGDAVWSIADDDTGNIWLGVYGGVSVLNRQTGKVFRSYQHKPDNPRSLGSNTLRTIFRDSRGRIWLGALLGGLHQYNPATNDFTRYEPNTANSTSAAAPEVRAIVEDESNGKPNGKIWAGMWGGGVGYFDPDTERFTVFRHNQQDSTTLANDIVRSLLVASDGVLWVGTNKGLCRFDRQKRTFTTFREEHGLPNNVVYAIQEDGEHCLWLSTNKGLAYFEPSTGRVRSYTTADGLPDDEFNGNVSCKGKDGTLYFGSLKGVAIVRPWLLLEEPPAPTVIFTGFKIFNRSAHLDTAIEERSTLEVAYLDNFLTFTFAALAYSGAKSIEYRYILEGFDKAWVESGRKLEAIYTNLNPGEYRLRVQARRSGGEWGVHKEAHLRLIVVPPWWMTMWFRAFVIFLVFAVAGSTIWARLRMLRHRAEYLNQEVERRTEDLRVANEEINRQLGIQTEQAREIELANTTLQEQNEELQSLNTEKSEIMGIVSHDLKNPISAIRTFADLIDTKVFTGEEADTAIKQIVHVSDRMLNLVKNLLDVNRLELGSAQMNIVAFDVLPIVETTVWQYSSQAEAKNITLHFRNEATDSTVFADEQAVMQVLDNLISNAVKYSPHGRNIFVRMKSEEGNMKQDNNMAIASSLNSQTSSLSPRSLALGSSSFLRMEIQDEGPGISEEDMKRLFGKFSRLSATPTGGEHSTGLGLSIVKKMMKAMNGKVWCESKLGKGATFIVELPKALPLP